MEETVGRWWHHSVTRWASSGHPDARVTLAEMQRSIGVLFRAAGGAAATRLTAAAARQHGGTRSWLKKLAGSGQRADTAHLEPEVLALPPALAVFADATLNRDLYLWLALQSAGLQPTNDWLGDNVRATQAALQAFPGFAPRYRRLLAAHLAQRPQPDQLKGDAALAEAAVREGLTAVAASETAMHSGLAAITPARAIPPIDAQCVAPVWLWLSAGPGCAALARDAATSTPPPATGRSRPGDPQRRRAQQTQSNSDRQAMVLPFRAEALMSWNEMVHVNRSSDDDDDGNALDAANDMDVLSVAPDGQSLASRVKFDLDLPSSSADDAPLGPGIALPEWDFRQRRLLPDHCRVQEMQARNAPDFKPNAALQRTARAMRRRLEVLRDLPRPQHAQDSGDDIDLDAWVRFASEQSLAMPMQTDTPAVYLRHSRTERSLATLLLADLSLSTDAYATQDARVIDIIRDALLVFGEALSASGDPFAMWGFSSVRRSHVRLQLLKSFAQAWRAPERNRVGAIKPGYYTRMGAAIRHATQQLQARPEQRRLLMLLTDGKPNDLDVYEGRYGLEDTRHAIHEARQAGLTPFCVTVDQQARDYLPLLFGAHGFALVQRPQDLVRQLTQAWVSLSAR